MSGRFSMKKCFKAFLHLINIHCYQAQGQGLCQSSQPCFSHVSHNYIIISRVGVTLINAWWRHLPGVLGNQWSADSARLPGRTHGSSHAWTCMCSCERPRCTWLVAFHPRMCYTAASSVTVRSPSASAQRSLPSPSWVLGQSARLQEQACSMHTVFFTFSFLDFRLLHFTVFPLTKNMSILLRCEIIAMWFIVN